MKFTLLTCLAAFQGAAAFHVAPASSSSKTALFSTPSYGGLAQQDQAVNGYGQASAPPAYDDRREFAGKPALADKRRAKDVWETLSKETVQGNSLRTWSIPSNNIERVQVFLRTEGRPLNADVELWQGPDNTPQKMAVYIEDGSLRPFRAVIESPGGSNAIAVRNTAHMEFPLDAAVEAGCPDGLNPKLIKSKGRTIQGGAVHTYPFAPNVESVFVLLKTDGRPLTARLELLQGPNNNKQVIELDIEDGLERPFMMVLETPGTGNVVRIVNTATVEFPLTATVEPYMIGSGYSETGSIKSDFVVGGATGAY